MGSLQRITPEGGRCYGDLPSRNEKVVGSIPTGGSTQTSRSESTLRLWGSDRALAILECSWQDTNAKLREVARQLTGRARCRRTGRQAGDGIPWIGPSSRARLRPVPPQRLATISA